MIRGLIANFQNIRGQIENNHFGVNDAVSCQLILHSSWINSAERKLPQTGCNRVPHLLHDASPNMPHPHDHCLGRKRGHSEKRPQKERGGAGRRALWTGERRQNKTKKPEEERTNKGGFFRKLRKVTENRENTNRGGKKTREQGCKQRTDENKRKGIQAREKDQNRRTQLEGTNSTGEPWKRKERRTNRKKLGNKEQRKQKKSKKRGE